MLPLISICIPTYNQADKLKFLLDSIRVQTFRDFEVIVSDDSNCDDVALLCNSYSDLPISYYRNQPAKGTPENWNYAISLAKGTWIKLMHHDDYFAVPESLAKFVSFAQENEDAEFFYSRTSILYYPSNRKEDYKVDQTILKRIAEQPSYLFFKNLIGSPSVTFFRSIDILKFDNQLKWLVDIEAYLRFLKSKKVCQINQILIETIASDSQLTEMMRDNPEYEITEYLYCYRAHYRTSTSINKRILNTRMILLLHQFNLATNKELVPYLKGFKAPKIAKVYFFLCRFNKRLAFSLLYRINKFNLLRQAD